jgi:uncharacterized LabA/DUF88 family protein
MQQNYFFIDGSALMAQIRQLRRARPIFADRKLCPKKFLEFFMRKLGDLHSGEYKRAIFYFANGDDANVETHFEAPNIRKPGEIRDLHFKYCGHKLKKSEEFERFVEKSVPAKFQGRFSKSEKGIDIEMCCDALKLASAGNIERLFLLSNDGDFIPFCRTIKEFGANISMIYLSDIIPPNGDLLQEADSYDVVGTSELYSIFLPPPTEAEIAAETAAPAALAEADAIEEMLSEKPEAEPSDLETINEEGDES